MITFQYLRRWVRLGACVFAFTYSFASSADMVSFATGGYARGLQTTEIMAKIDTNGDGMSDILWQGTNGQAVVWQMSGTNILTNAAIGPNPGTSWHVIAASS